MKRFARCHPEFQAVRAIPMSARERGRLPASLKSAGHAADVLVEDMLQALWQLTEWM
jgi:hypothetical protein